MKKTGAVILALTIFGLAGDMYRPEDPQLKSSSYYCCPKLPPCLPDCPKPPLISLDK